MAMVSVVNWQPTGGLMAQDDWLDPKVGGHLALWCIHQMNRVNSLNALSMKTAHHKDYLAIISYGR